MGVAFFDLDHTVLDINSANLWVRHEWRAGRLSAVDAAKGGWWVLRYGLGFAGGMDEIYRDIIRRLAGMDEEELAERTRLWFESEVVHHLRPGAKVAMETHRIAGDRLVVATSSSLYVARAAQAAWGFDDIVHTSFAVEDGKFTGEIDGFAYGAQKYDRVAEWAAHEEESLKGATFYTDSVTDLKLLEHVGKPVAVNPDRPLRKIAAKRGWAIVDWGHASKR